MAEVVVESSDRRIYGAYDWLWVGIAGAALGIVMMALSWLLGTYVIDPLLCRGDAIESCAQSGVIAGNVAAVIVAIVGAGVLIRLRVRRALIVVLATLISFWNLTTLLDGLGGFEVVAWMAGLHAFAYLVFASLLRIRSFFVALIFVILMVIALRWVAFL